MATKHRRPIVWRDDYLVNDGINPWVAAVRRPSGYGYTGHNFATHAEALAHANYMACIIEATQPQVGSTITADLQAIALVLLAHHYRGTTP